MAFYEEMTEETLRELDQVDETEKPEEERVLTLFDHFESKAKGADFRRCPFIHASLQAAEPRGTIHALVHSYKSALRKHVLGLLNEDRGNLAELADQIVMLLDGAVAESYLKGVAHPTRSAKHAATALLRCLK